MDAMRIIRFIVLCGACLTAASMILYIKDFRKTSPPLMESLTASNTYLGPTRPGPDTKQLIKVEVILRDSPEANGVQIVSAEFDEKSIPLKPRDVYGNRGMGSFQVKPGTYKLLWKVNRDKSAWPRIVEHEEEVTVSPRDLWLQILIEGEDASIR